MTVLKGLNLHLILYLAFVHSLAMEFGKARLNNVMLELTQFHVQATPLIQITRVFLIKMISLNVITVETDDGYLDLSNVMTGTLWILMGVKVIVQFKTDGSV